MTFLRECFFCFLRFLFRLLSLVRKIWRRPAAISGRGAAWRDRGGAANPAPPSGNGYGASAPLGFRVSRLSRAWPKVGFRLCCSVWLALLGGGAVRAQDGPLARELPRWLSIDINNRYRVEHDGDGLYFGGTGDGFVLNRLHVGVGFKPSRYLSFYAQGQDSRAVWQNPGFPHGNDTDVFDLRQGYVIVGDAKKGWWDLKVGRQELVFGTERLLGINQWANLPRTWDAAKLALHRGENRLDLFASSVVRVSPNEFDQVQAGFNIHGAYAHLVNTIPHHIFEPHVLWRTRPQAVDEDGNVGHGDVWTYGARLASQWKSPFNYAMELDWQNGRIVRDDLRAFMGMWQATYELRDLRFKPTLLGEFTYATGDGGRGDGKIGTFDQLLARAHRIWGIVDHIGGRNSRIFQTGVKFTPARKLQVSVDNLAIWLASAHDGLYRNNGVLIIPAIPGGARSTYVGDEVDLQTVYTMSPFVRIGAGYAYLRHGSFIREARANPGSPNLAYLFLELSAF